MVHCVWVMVHCAWVWVWDTFPLAGPFVQIIVSIRSASVCVCVSPLKIFFDETWKYVVCTGAQNLGVQKNSKFPNDNASIPKPKQIISSYYLTASLSRMWVMKKSRMRSAMQRAWAWTAGK